MQKSELMSDLFGVFGLPRQLPAEHVGRKHQLQSFLLEAFLLALLSAFRLVA